MKRTYLTSGLVIIILAGVALSGGCVTMTKYKAALAANNRMRVEVEKVRESLRTSEYENEELTDQLDATKLAAKTREDQLVSAEQQNKYLEMRFAKLAEEYRKLAGKKPDIEFKIRLPDHVDKALRAFAKDNPELLTYLPKYGMVKLKADLTFKKGSDYVATPAASALEKFATIISSPAAEKFNVYVAGHTDNIPIVKRETLRRHPDNWYLSVHRAVAVQKVLLKAGIAAHRVGAMGFGEYHPVEPNKASGGGNPTNRRVEIWIVPPSRYLTKEETEESE